MSQLVIKKHRPGYWIGWGLVLLALMAASNYGLFRYFTREAHQDYLALQRENLRVAEDNQRLEVENRELRENQAIIERNIQVEREAMSRSDAALEALQGQLIELKKQIAFYQGLTSAGGLKSGVNIEKFELAAGAKAGEFHFLLVLTRVLKNGSVSRGTAHLVVRGTQGEQERELDLGEISTDSTSELAFKFKYFQNLEGDIRLPDGFRPREVQIRVETGKSKQAPLEEVFDWPVEEKS